MAKEGDIPLALQPPAPGVKIRPVLLADINMLNEYCWPQQPDFARGLVKRALRLAQQGRGLGVVVEVDDTVCGYGQLTLWPGCGEISDLTIAETHRNKGLGTAVIRHLVRSAQDMHLPCIEIGAAKRNLGALALYRRLGFRDNRHIMLNLGHGREPVLYLRLELNEDC